MIIFLSPLQVSNRKFIENAQNQQCNYLICFGHVSRMLIVEMFQFSPPFFIISLEIIAMIAEKVEKGGITKRQNKPQQKIIELMIQQYYNYLSLLKLTNNFEKKLARYQGLDIEKYDSCLAFVGNISEIKTDQKTKNYIFPIVNTPINSYLFTQQVNPYFRRPHSPIKRTLVIRQQNYIKLLVLPFNKIISLSKKEKEQYFIFTHLDIYLKDGKELNFSLTQHSQIIQLQRQFYKAVLYPLEASLQNNYSEINLNLVYPNGMLQRNSTFSVNEVKNKINENILTIPIMGQLRKIHRDSYEKPVNAKEKQVILDIIQDTYPNDFSSLGLCRLYVRFDILDEEQMIDHMQEGSVYVFRISEVDLNKNLQLIFKLNHWKNNMIRVTTQKNSYNIQEKYKKMKIQKLATLTYPVIFRNHYKFKIVKTDIKFMNIKVICQKCQRSILRINEDQYHCRGQCGKINGDLKFWVILGCMDQSGTAEVTLEDQIALSFFNLEAEAHKIKDQTLKEQVQPGKAISLYYKKKKQSFNDDQFQNGIIYDKNPYLLAILNQCQVAVIQKQIIAYVKPATNQIFYNLDEKDKNQYQVSFARSKEYIKKAKIFLNGQLKELSERILLVPHLKALRVYSL